MSRGEFVDLVERGCRWGVQGQSSASSAMRPAAGSGEPGCVVQQAVAQAFGFGQVAVEGGQPGPGEQVVRGHRQLQPHGVDGEGFAGVRPTRCSVVADPSFDSAVAAVQRFDVGDVGAVGVVVGDVGEQYLQAPSGGVAETGLRAGPAVFAAGVETRTHPCKCPQPPARLNATPPAWCRRRPHRTPDPRPRPTPWGGPRRSRP